MIRRKKPLQRGGWIKRKPKKPKPPRDEYRYQDSVLVRGNGREICTKTRLGKLEYERRREVMWLRQGKRCEYCGEPLTAEQATFDHEDGRGMGGSKRDDRIEKDGQSYNCAACYQCNSDKGSLTKERYLEKRRARNAGIGN